MTVQQVVKWGNSLALRIPAALAKQMRVAVGKKVTIRVEGRRLVVEAADELPPFTEADMKRALKAMKRVRPREDPFGRPRGREIL